MKKIFIACLIGFLLTGFCAAQSTWTGSTSSDWNVASNWSPASVPGTSATVVINNASAAFQPVLDANRTINILQISAGTLNLNGKTLTVGNDVQITGGTVTNLASDTSALVSNSFSQVSNATLNNIRISRTNAGANVVNQWMGGNTFINVTIRNQGGGTRAIRMATTLADIFDGNTAFDVRAGTNAGIRVSYSANSTFNGNIGFISPNSNGILTFGENGGSTTLASGSALKEIAPSTGIRFLFNNFTQNGTAANDTLKSSGNNVTITNSTFGGALRVVGGNGSVTSLSNSTLSNGIAVISQLGSISIENSQLPRDNYFFAIAFLEIANSTFSNLSGGTTIIRQGGSTNDLLSGGNTFHNLTVQRSGGSNGIYFANVNADTYNGTTRIVSGGTPIYMAHKGNNIFNGDIILSRSALSGTFFFCDGGGSATQNSGFSIKNDITNPTSGNNLVIKNFTQNGSTANGSFNLSNATFSNVTLNGNLTLNCTSQISVLGACIFAATNNWTADDFVGFEGCTFSSNPGASTTLVNVAGGAVNTLNGGNTFNNLTLSVFGTSQGMTFAATTPDTYNGNTTIISNGNNPIALGAAGANTFGGNITLSSTNGSASFTIGNASANSTLSGALLNDPTNPTSSFNNLTVNRLIQSNLINNGNFNLANATFDRVDFKGNLGLNLNSNLTVSGACAFAGTNNWTANDFIGFEGCTFSSNSGASINLTNLAGGAVNTLNGGNTFNNLTLSVFGNTQGMTFAATTPDTYNGNTTIISNGNNPIALGAAGANTFGGNITLSSTTGSASFTIGNSTTNSTFEGALLNDATNPTLSTNNLTLIRLIQSNLVNNGSFTLNNASFDRVILKGNLGLTCSNTLSVNGICNFDGTNIWTSPSFTGFEDCSFSSNTGASTTLSKLGTGGDNSLAGGNTFNNLTLILGNTISSITLAASKGDTYNGNTVLQLNGSSSGSIFLATSGVNSFGGNITLSRVGTHTGNFTIGNASSNSTLNGAWLSDPTNPSSVDNNITVRRLIQSTAINNSNFITGNVLLDRVDFKGDLGINATSKNLTLTGACNFSGNNTFLADNFITFENSSFSSTSGKSTTITKTGGGVNTLTGANTFNNLTILNNSNNNIIFAGSNPDVLNGNTLVRFNGNGNINLTSTGGTFNGNLTLERLSGTGNFAAGGTGTTTMAAGSAILNHATNLFTNSLTLTNFTQNGTAAHGTFSLATLSISNSTLGGNTNFTTSGNATISNSTLSGTNTLVCNSTLAINFSTLPATNTITGANLSGFEDSNFSTVSGTTSLTKTGGNTDILVGGCTYKNATLTHSGSGNLTFGNTKPESYVGNTLARINAAGTLGLTASGGSFDGNLTLAKLGSATGNISLGTSGTTTMTAGNAILNNATNPYTNGLTITNFTQNGTAAHGIFSLTNLSISNSTLGGNTNSTTSGNATISNSTLSGTNTLVCNSTLAINFSTLPATNTITGANLSGFEDSNFSTVSGTTSLTKTGGNTDILVGGCTYKNATLTHSGSGNLTFGNTKPESYVGNTLARINAAGTLGLTASGGSFDGNLTLAKLGSATGNISLGTSGTTTMTAGNAILNNATNPYTNGLTITNFTQNGTAAHGTFSLTTLSISNSTLGGNTNFTTSGNLSVSSSTLSASNTLTGGRLVNFNNSTFSNASGSTSLTKTGAAADLLSGGNTFHNLTITQSGNAALTFANVNPDTYNGSTLAIMNSASSLTLASKGSAFNGNLTLARQGTTTGGIIIGSTGGTTTMAAGSAILNHSTNLFTNSLTLTNFTQNGTAAHGTFSLTNLSISNSTLGGNTNFTTTGSITINSSTLSATNLLTAANFSGFSNSTFSSISGSTTMTKNSGTANTLSGGNTFHNLSLNLTGTGILTLANTNGDTYMGNASFTRTNGTLRIASNGQNNFHNNISVSSNAAANVNFGNGGGWVNVIGNTTQSYSANQVVSMGRLRMNSTGTLLLNSALNIGNEVDFASGIINPASSSQTLVFQDGSFATGGSNLSHVNGAVRKVGTNTFTFPIGKSGEYAPLGIGSSATSSTFSAEYFKTNFPNLAPFNSPLVKVSYCEYWDLTRVSGTGTPLVTLSWNDPRSCGVAQLGDLRVAHWTGSTWENLGNGSTTGNTTSGTITSALVSSSYSPFTLGSISGDNPLPITLLNFTAKPLENGGVSLDWQTSDERNFSHFVVERKTTAGFDSIAAVKAIGNSTNHYSFLDFDSELGQNYYRLKMVDADGSFSYSKVVSAYTSSSSVSSLKLYPNPAKNEIYVSGDFSLGSHFSIKNMFGAEVLAGKMDSHQSVRIDISMLSAGVYWLQVGEKMFKFVAQ